MARTSPSCRCTSARVAASATCRRRPRSSAKLTVEENILAILETLELSEDERRSGCASLLDELGIARLAKSKAHSLSGGERRRLEITRALVISPSFMLLDEPFAGIDPIAVVDIQGIVTQLKNARHRRPHHRPQRA